MAHSIVIIWKLLRSNYGQNKLPPAFYRELLLSSRSEQYLGQVHLSKIDNGARDFPASDGLKTLKTQILSVKENFAQDVKAATANDART